MASTKDLNDDLSVGMSEVRRTLEHYNLGDWQEYLLVRKPGCEGSFIVLNHPKDTGETALRLIDFHKAEARKEAAGTAKDDRFKNATLRPWRYQGWEESPDAGAYILGGGPPDSMAEHMVGAALPLFGNRAECEANAQLIVEAVNSFDSSAKSE